MTGCREAFAAYIDATNTHDFDCVEPLIHPTCSHWFGPHRHEGIEQIRIAFERAWGAVADEVYEVSDCRWLIETHTCAVVTYRYRWAGVVEGRKQTGGGLGTNILAPRRGGWQVVHEHLTPNAPAVQPKS
jgi:ketosteroid isomerase-like protein